MLPIPHPIAYARSAVGVHGVRPSRTRDRVGARHTPLRCFWLRIILANRIRRFRRPTDNDNVFAL